MKRKASERRSNRVIRAHMVRHEIARLIHENEFRWFFNVNNFACVSSQRYLAADESWITNGKCKFYKSVRDIATRESWWFIPLLIDTKAHDHIFSDINYPSMVWLFPLCLSSSWSSREPGQRRSRSRRKHCTCRCQSFSVTLNLFSPSFRNAQIFIISSLLLFVAASKSRCVWHIAISFRENQFTAASHRYIVPWIYARRHNILFISFWFSFRLSRLATFENNFVVESPLFGLLIVSKASSAGDVVGEWSSMSHSLFVFYLPHNITISVRSASVPKISIVKRAPVQAKTENRCFILQKSSPSHRLGESLSWQVSCFRQIFSCTIYRVEETNSLTDILAAAGVKGKFVTYH